MRRAIPAFPARFTSVPRSLRPLKGGVLSLRKTSILRPMPYPRRSSARAHRPGAGTGWLESSGLQERKSQARQGRGASKLSTPSGHGFADYLLYVDGKAAGVVEAKKEGVPLIGVEIQAAKYSKGLPTDLPAHIRPLPFLYQSTGVETRFTNGLDPEPRSRQIFAFHKPETLAAWITQSGAQRRLRSRICMSRL